MTPEAASPPGAGANPDAAGRSPDAAGGTDAAPPAGPGTPAAGSKTPPAGNTAPPTGNTAPPAGPPRRGGGGCATGVGVLLILFGGVALWWNLAGFDALFLLLAYAPLAAAWWPAALVLWGLVKVFQRLRTGYSRFGFGEAVLLVVVLLLGLSLSAGRSLLENLGLEMRFGGVRRWIAEQSRPLPQHAFVRERVVSLPATGPATLELVLPAGSILVDAAALPAGAGDLPPAASPRTGAGESPDEGEEDEEVADDGEDANDDEGEDDSEGDAEDRSGGAGGPAGETGARREAALTLGIRVRAPDAETAAARAGEIRIVESRPDGAGSPVVRLRVVDPRGVSPDSPPGSPTGSGAHRSRADDPLGLRFSEAALDLTVTAPPGISVTARSERGAVRVRGPFAAVSVDAGDGPVEITGARGEAAIVARDGPVRAHRLGGPLRVRARRAPIEVGETGGAVSVDSAGAPIRISEVAGPVTVRATRGLVDIEGAGGAVSVDTRLAPVTLRGLAGGAEVRSEYGSVFAVGVAGGLDLRADSGAVEVRGVTGGARITAGAGPVLLSAAAGEIVVRSAEDADLDVRLDGPLDGEPGSTAPVTVTTAGGEVWLELPEGRSFALRADTDSRDRTGAVESEIPLERTDRTDGDGADWVGSVGAASPSAPVSIRTGGGDLVVRSGEPYR